MILPKTIGFTLDLTNKEALQYLFISQYMRQDFDFMVQEGVTDIADATEGTKEKAILHYIFFRGLQRVFKELQQEQQEMQAMENGKAERKKMYILYFAYYDSFKIISLHKKRESAEALIPALDQEYAAHPTVQHEELELEHTHFIMEMEVVD